MLLRSVIALLSIFILPVAFAEEGPASPCLTDALSTSLAALSPSFSPVLEFVRKLDPKLVSMERTPGWQEIEDLKTAIGQLKSAKLDLASQGRLEEAKTWAAQAEASLKSDPKLSAIVTQVRSATLKDDYRPGEHALKRLYVKLLYAFDKELPPNIRIPFRHLPLDTRPPKLLEAARTLVANQEKRLAGSFATSGFSDDAQLRAAINSAGGHYKELLDAFDQGKVEFAMNRPEGARWWVPKVGFENQRNTGSSGGTMNPNYRDEVEAKLTGTKASLYKTFDNELKPEYGYLRPTPDFGLKQSEAAAQYGSDIYIFKKDRVRDRLTWTTGDSFGIENLVSNEAENPVAKSWQGFFIPWKYRSLLVPEVESLVEKQNLGFEAGGMSSALDMSTPTLAGLGRLKAMIWPPSRDSIPPKPLEPFTSKGARGYIELQYFGPLGLDDVEIFQFQKTPPSGEFLDELRKRKIKIRDGRQTPAVEWNGEQEEKSS
jgi:hypothetical protein